MDAHGDDGRNARRKFLTRSATLVAAGVALPALPVLARKLSGEAAVASAGMATANPLRRANVHGSDRFLAIQNMRLAVKTMLALPPEDPRNWYRQAMIHVLDCPHGNAWFFPWHRGYLYWFERIVRKLSFNPAFVLPYWDWTSAPDMPPSFFGEFQGDQLDIESPGYIHDFPTFDRTFRRPMEAFWGSLTQNRRRQLELRGMANFEAFWAVVQDYFNRGTRRQLSFFNRQLTGDALEAVSRTTLVNALAPTDFNEFGGSLIAYHSGMDGEPGMVEAQPHNLVHRAIGGYMGNFIAASDPMFWLHHANVDRLWDVWMERQGLVAQNGPPAWRNEPFLFFCDEDGRAIDGTAGDYVSSSGLGYSFEATAPIATAPSRPPNAAWAARFPCQLQSTNLAINGSVTASVEPGKAASDAFAENCQTAILIDLDRPQDEQAWRFKVEIKVDNSSFSSKHGGYTAFFGSMGAEGSSMRHRGQLKIGIANGMSQCLAESGNGPHRFTVTVRAERVGNGSPTEVLKVYGVTLISV
ncbi:tyrosinase family protein [Pinirhizobacter soli]|uniref:tyrosinase family protein n=1 Tax=Pinirhizobacter soli TaxID=2786953 RepID=UPI00202A42C7|nr:tyrosinase family protein [Pinirhizobacter soli]